MDSNGNIKPISLFKQIYGEQAYKEHVVELTKEDFPKVSKMTIKQRREWFRAKKDIVTPEGEDK